MYQGVYFAVHIIVIVVIISQIAQETVFRQSCPGKAKGRQSASNIF
jgi:hypothetical protein